MSEEARKVFNKVKPLCIAVSKKKDSTSLQILHGYIKHLSSNAVQELHEYLLFPLRVAITQEPKFKEDVVIASADCMRSIFQKVSIDNWKTFNDLYYVLLLQITSSSGGDIQASGSEDRKLCILKTISTLLCSSLHKHWFSFYDVNNISSVGHFVTLCLSTIKTEASKSLRNVAIDALKALANQSSSFIEKDKALQCFLVGNCIACFLPGVLSVLVKVVSGDVKQGQAAKSKAIDTITVLLKVSAGDSALKLYDDSHVKKYVKETIIRTELKSFLVDRNEFWVDDVAAKMHIILDHLSTACDHCSSKVRLSVLQFSCEMLLSCHKNLFKTYIGTLLRIPCKLLSDDVKEIKLKSIKILDDFSLNCQANSAVQEVLLDELFNLCSRLPNIMTKSSDAEKLSCLKLIFGFLDVQKHNLTHLCYTSAHVNNLLKSLLYCFELECSNMLKIEEVTSETNYDSAITSFFKGQSRNWLFRKTFLHFHDEEISKILVKISRLLGKFGDLDVLVDCLKEQYESEQHCRATVLLLNEILLGACADTKISKDLYFLVHGLIDIYVADENWYLCTSVDSLYISAHHTMRIQSKFNSLAIKEKNLSNVTLKTLNSNIILACLHLEALAAFSLVLSFDFRKTLIKSLYPLLEKVNDHNHLISTCAIKALNCVSVSCKYGSIAELMIHNLDYLVSTISIHLRHLNLFPRSPAVLRAMLTHSDASVFPLVQDTIDDILSTMDIHYHNNQYLRAFLSVFKSAAEAIKNWFSEKKVFLETATGNETVAPETIEQSSSASNITDYLHDFYINSKIAALDDDFVTEEDSSAFSDKEIPDPNLTEDVSAPNLSSDDKKDVQPHIKTVERIIQRCSHLLTNSDSRIRLLVLDIIKESIYSVYKEENIFLPLVHKLWKPLASRCADPELQVVEKAFDIICCLGEHCGTFMRRRFTKDILPNLITFLKTRSKPLMNSDASVVYSHTTIFKLQVVLLNGLGPLLLSVTVNFKDLHAVCDACRHYLSCKHHSELQRAAINLFKYLIKLNPDSLWLFLSDTWSPIPTYKPDSNKATIFNDISVAGTSDQGSEFATNILYLLNLC